MNMLRRKKSRGLIQDCSGALTIEMSLVAVATFFMIPILMDIMSSLSSGMTLSASLRAGAQIALAQPSNTTAIQEAITQAGGFAEGSVVVTTNTFCECDGLTVVCSTPSCSGGTTPATFMTLTAYYDTPTYINYPDPNPFAITRTTSIRVR